MTSTLVTPETYIRAETDCARELRADSQVHRVTFVRAHMQGRLLQHDDVVLLCKPAGTETSKTNSSTSRRLSIRVTGEPFWAPLNFVVNLFAGLIAYCLQLKKPLLRMHDHALLSAA